MKKIRRNKYYIKNKYKQHFKIIYTTLHLTIIFQAEAFIIINQQDANLMLIRINKITRN